MWVWIGETFGVWGQLAALVLIVLAFVFVMKVIGMLLEWLAMLFGYAAEMTAVGIATGIIWVVQGAFLILWWLLLLPVRAAMLPFKQRAAPMFEDLPKTEHDLELFRVNLARFQDRFESFEEFVRHVHSGAWRAEDWAREEAGEEKPKEPEPESAEYEYARALEVLGLEVGGFTEEEFRRRHRELMKRVHPDAGGSSHLARLLNEAAAAVKARHGWR